MDEMTTLIINFLDSISQIVAFGIGLYVLFESFTAINEMPKVSVSRFFHELKNPYTLKYWLLGVYGLLVMYHSAAIRGLDIILITPAILCVVNRTIYRWRNSSIYGYIDP
jgi:hypothetical protein